MFGYKTPTSRRSSVENLINTDVDTPKLFELLLELKKSSDIIELENMLLIKFLMVFTPKSYDRVSKFFGIQLNPSLSVIGTRTSILPGNAQVGSIRTATSMNTLHSKPKPLMTPGLSMGSYRQDNFVNISTKLSFLETECRNYRKMVTCLDVERLSKVRELSIQIDSMKIDHDEIKTADDLLQQHFDGAQKMSPQHYDEHFQMFIKNWFEDCRSLVESFRLKTMTLQRNFSKKTEILKEKEELSGILRPVDFDSLEIKRDTLRKDLKEKTQHLKGLKEITANTSLCLMDENVELGNVRQTLNDYNKKIEMAEKTLQTLKRDEDLLNEQIRLENVEQQKLDRYKEFRVPGIIDYVKMKAELDDKTKLLKRLRRENYLIKIKLEGEKRKLKI